MESATKIYDRTLIAVFKENRKVLRDMVKESNDLFYQSRERKYTLLPTLKKLQSSDVNTAHYYVQVVDYLNEMTKALMHITRPAFEYIDNNHEGLSKEQAKDLMSINDDVESIYRHINQMLRDGDFSEIEMVLTLRDQLFESIAEAIKSEALAHQRSPLEYQGQHVVPDDPHRNQKHGAAITQPAQITTILSQAPHGAAEVD